MKKKYYTYEKILLGLRDEYLRNQALLNKLKKYIYIGDLEYKIESFCIKANFKDEVKPNQIIESDDNVVRLILQITQKLSTIQQVLAKINSLICSGETLQNNLMYELEKENDSYNFIKICKQRRVTIEPELRICGNSGDTEFTRLVEQILNSEFMLSHEKNANRLFCGAMLNITPQQIYLGEYHQNIIYFPNEDILQVCGFNDTKQVSNFMNYQIHSDYLDDNIKTLIDRAYRDDDFIAIEPVQTNGKVTRFSIDETSNGLKLMKIKKR